MNDTILREEPIHWVQSPPQPSEASSVGTLSVEARQQAWPVAEVQALLDLSFPELMHRAQTV
ncbi:MAG: biotin synthase BioB, partial [Hydrogenophaga sp.]|nr:biotin synthase BioB [Hydrogenophaga sp.]